MTIKDAVLRELKCTGMHVVEFLVTILPLQQAECSTPDPIRVVLLHAQMVYSAAAIAMTIDLPRQRNTCL